MARSERHRVTWDKKTQRARKYKETRRADKWEEGPSKVTRSYAAREFA